MSSRNVGAVTLVILLGLVIGTLGLVEADLYAVGVLLLFLGGVGAAVLMGEYLIRYFSAKRHALAAAATASAAVWSMRSVTLDAPEAIVLNLRGSSRGKRCLTALVRACLR